MPEGENTYAFRQSRRASVVLLIIGLLLIGTGIVLIAAPGPGVAPIVLGFVIALAGCLIRITTNHDRGTLQSSIAAPAVDPPPDQVPIGESPGPRPGDGDPED